jgi:uncharacterized FlaG/YvyC family protein
MKQKPTLTYNDLVVAASAVRIFAISYQGEKLPSSAVSLFTKKDGTHDAKYFTRFDETKFGAARRAIREIPPELVVKLYADTAAWESNRAALAYNSSKPKADAFIAAYKIAKNEFDAKIAALESDHKIKESWVDYDFEYNTTTLLVTVSDQQTGVTTTFNEVIDN